MFTRMNFLSVFLFYAHALCHRWQSLAIKHAARRTSTGKKYILLTRNSVDGSERPQHPYCSDGGEIYVLHVQTVLQSAEKIISYVNNNNDNNNDKNTKKNTR